MAALGIGPGDEVIVPEITWIASAAPITYLGGSLGGDNARRVQFWPVSGRAMQRFVDDAAQIRNLREVPVRRAGSHWRW